MTTLSINDPVTLETGDFGEAPVVAADIIYQGAAVGIVTASGHARPLTSADKFVGFSRHQADNSTGAAADINVRYWKRGAIKLAISGAVITDIGLPVYATDDDISKGIVRLDIAVRPVRAIDYVYGTILVRA